MLSTYIEQLLLFALDKEMIYKEDLPLCRNQLMSLLKVAEPVTLKETFNIPETPVKILEKILDEAFKKSLFPDNTTTQRDLFDAKIMGCLMPRQSELKRIFDEKVIAGGIEAGTDYFYALSQHSNYIRTDRIEKNMYWRTSTEYGNLEITINLSKPEKDPKEIAAAKNAPQSSYPKCFLCLENVGYEGRMNHPGRANHRILPLTLDNEKWYFQYSPYVYYNEHSIILKEDHVPMRIQKKTFKRLLDFTEQFPHYFLGSNADLPIVGGSILSHDHFQGGNHTFPMEEAPIITVGRHEKFCTVSVGIVKWPLSVARIASTDKEALIDVADEILEHWRSYSDESLDIHAFTGEIPHNTITPIARVNKEGLFELDLVLRNNRQSDEYPDGIYHPHAHLQHIKKENIGLIEVMGLAVLPARLKAELKDLENFLTAELSIDTLDKKLTHHKPWLETLITTYGQNNSSEDAWGIIEKEVGKKFSDVLSCAGVYKMNESGLKGMQKFLETCNCKF